MSGVGGWRDGSRYRIATASSTSSSSRGSPWNGNSEREKGENTQKLTSEGGQRAQASIYQQQQAQCVGPYVMVTPNETRRKQLQQIAKKELDDLERWKEEHRPGPITLVPQRLGGNESEAQVRQNQQMILMQSKYQKKHKREEYIKAKKAAEEAEILKKKAIQREKAERLEFKKEQKKCKEERISLKIKSNRVSEEQQWPQYQPANIGKCLTKLHMAMLKAEPSLKEEQGHHKTNELLNRLDMGLPKSDSCQIANPGPKSTAWKRSHAYKRALREDENRRLEEMKQEQQRKAELMEFKQKQEEEARTRAHQNEQRRVNNAFLDRLQNRTQTNNVSQPGYMGLPQ